MSVTLADLKKSQPEALDQFKAELTTELQAVATKAQEAAVAAALAAQAAKPAPAATLAELKTVVPESVAGRDTIILGLLDQSSSVATAQLAVIKNLADQNKALAAELTTVKAAKGLGKEGLGVPALTLTGKPEETATGGDFEKLVVSISTSEKLPIDKAIVKAAERDEKAHRDWVDRKCPKIG